ncbi:MAG: P-loop NTPase fold protein [Methanosarcinales archaeon]
MYVYYRCFIGVEKDVIERGIEVRYRSKEREIPISGKDYIEKIIQLPFTLPSMRRGYDGIY